MDLRYLRKILEETSPIPFIGVFYSSSLEKLEIPLENFCCLLVDHEKEHYTLAGVYNSLTFHFNSENYQNKPICSIYILFYLWMIKSPSFSPNFLATFKHHSSSIHSRTVSDILVYELIIVLCSVL